MKHVPCVCKVWSLCLMGELLSVMASAATETISGAPDAYLDYVEATGSQYIDTGVNAETGLKARIDMEWGAEVKALADGGDDWSMLDARKTSGATRFYMCHIAKNKAEDDIVFGYGYNDWHRTSTNAVRETRFEVLTDFSDQATLHYYKNGAEMLDSGQITGHKSDTVNLGLNLYLFACNYNGTASYGAHAKLYECKIFKKNFATDDMEIQRHFLPARKNGHIGLYDKANNMFYYDAANELVAGAELPRPAAFVEWVEADGSASSSVAQQYVDTGVWGKLGLKSVVDVTLLESDGDHAILAARAAGTGNYRLYMAYHYNTYFCYGDGKLREPKSVTPASGTRYVIESDLSTSSQSVKVNGTELYKDTFTGTSYFATDSTLTLFANNHKSAYVKNPSHSRLYSARIWDGDEMLRDFSPCIATNSAGTTFAGLYDAVSRRIFEPTSKAFDLASQVGPVTNVLVAVDPPKTRLEYLDSDGVADYIDLGVAAKDGIEMDAVMEWLAVPSDGAFVGARTDLQNNHDNGKAGVRFFPYHHWQSGGSGHRIGYDGQVPGNEQIAAANTKYCVKSHLDAGDQWYTVQSYENGAWSAPNTTVTSYAGPVNTGLSLWLFAINFDSTPKYHGRARVYSLKLRAKQPSGAYAPALNLVPVRDPLTGGAALWDKVGERYYRSGGSFRLAGGGAERPLTPGFLVILR